MLVHLHTKRQFWGFFGDFYLLSKTQGQLRRNRKRRTHKLYVTAVCRHGGYSLSERTAKAWTPRSASCKHSKTVYRETKFNGFSFVVPLRSDMDCPWLSRVKWITSGCNTTKWPTEKQTILSLAPLMSETDHQWLQHHKTAYRKTTGTYK